MKQETWIKMQEDTGVSEKHNEKKKTSNFNTSRVKYSADDYYNRQIRAYVNKLNHGFNVTDFHKEARFINKEVAELMDAIEHNDLKNLMEELADIVIFSYGLAEMAHGDLDTEIFKKMEINENRKYIRNAVGDFVKVEEGDI